MRKKLVTLLLATSMALSLFGCKESSSEKGKKTNSTENSDNNVAEVLGFASYDYIDEIMGKTESINNSTLYKYADFITLGDYKGLEAEADFSLKEVTDEEFETALKEIVSYYDTTNTVTTGTVKDGDSINLDFKGLLDGEAFDNGTATDYDYTIGGGFIEDLDRGLIGLEVGKQYSIPCTFPESYGEETLAGKDVVFEVTVNYIVETVAAELTDDLAKKIAEDNLLSDSFDSVETLKTYLREQMEKNALTEFKDSKFDSVWPKVLANCQFDGVPQVDYDATYNSMLNNIESQYAQYQAYGFDRDTFLSMFGLESEEALANYCKDSATDYIKTKLAIMAIADKEGVTVSEQEYLDCVNQYVTAYSFENLDALLEELGNSKYAFIEERYYEVAYKKVEDIILENSKEVEKTVETEVTSTETEVNN